MRREIMQIEAWELMIHVSEIESGFTVAFQDIESGEFIEGVHVFDSEEKAVGYAKAQAEKILEYK